VNPYLRLLLCAVLAWQAVVGAGELVFAALRGLSHGYGERLGASTEERIAMVLGSDGAVWHGLRELPPGAVVVPRVVARESATRTDVARLRLITRLRHLLYPDRFVTGAVPDAIGFAEGLARPGNPAWLLVLPGDPEPVQRPGWQAMRHEEDFQLWRLQKD
jgi:hypothetical protein